MAKGKIVKYPRTDHRGSLTIVKATSTWLGRWNIYATLKDGTLVSRRKGANLGKVSEVSKEDAEILLRRRMKMSQVKYRSLSAAAQSRNQDWFIKEPLVRGAAAEFLASIDLLRRGFQVYKNVNPTGRCDLAAQFPESCEFIRVEVKTGVLKNGVPQIEVERQRGQFDVVALVDPQGAVHYFDADLSGIDLDQNQNLSGVTIDLWFQEKKHPKLENKAANGLE